MARITSVVDGDTVCLVGIDTPETKRRGVAMECEDKQATAKMLRRPLSVPAAASCSAGIVGVSYELVKVVQEHDGDGNGVSSKGELGQAAERLVASSLPVDTHAARRLGQDMGSHWPPTSCER